MQTQAKTQDFLLRETRAITKKTMQDPNFKKIHHIVHGDKYNRADIDPGEYADDKDCQNYAAMAVGFKLK
jgi:hypothetical protein